MDWLINRDGMILVKEAEKRRGHFQGLKFPTTGVALNRNGLSLGTLGPWAVGVALNVNVRMAGSEWDVIVASHVRSCRHAASTGTFQVRSSGSLPRSDAD